MEITSSLVFTQALFDHEKPILSILLVQNLDDPALPLASFYHIFVVNCDRQMNLMGENFMEFDQFIAMLRKVYQAKAGQLERKIAREPWSIKDSFIHLALLLDYHKRENDTGETSETSKASTSGAQPSADPLLQWHDFHVNRAERVYESKQLLAMSSIFAAIPEQELEATTQVWVQGAAGSGKSTLCQRVAYEWSDESEPFTLPTPQSPFHCVIWIQLKALKNYLDNLKKLPIDEEDDSILQSVTALAMYLRKSLPEDDRKDWSSKQIKTLLKTNETSILFLLDGYDEIAALAENHPVIQILQNYLLRQPNLLVTSRPQHGLGNKIAEYRQIELLGFSTADSLAYVDRHFQDKPLASGYEKLKSWLQTSTHIMGIAHIPVNVEILCALMSGEGSVELPDLANAKMTDLYTELLAYLNQRYWQKGFVGWDKNILFDQMQCQERLIACGLLSGIGELALQGLLGQRIIFDADEVKACLRRHLQGLTEIGLFQYLFNLGILRGFTWELNDTDMCNFTGQGEFLHLTLQEYFAADYLATCWLNNRQQVLELANQEPIAIHQFVATYKYQPHFSYVWPFMMGRLKHSPEAVDALLAQLLSSPRPLFPHSRDTELMLSVLNELEKSKDISRAPPLQQTLWQWLEHSFDWWLETDRYWRNLSSLFSRYYPMLINTAKKEERWLAQTARMLSAKSSEFRPLPSFIQNKLPGWLVDEDENVRYRALALARQLTPLPEVIVDQLPGLLVDEHWQIHAQALALAHQLTPLPEAIIVQLLVWFVDERYYVRDQTLELAQLLSPLPKAIVDQWLAWLVDEDRDIRTRALVLARQLTPLPAAIVDQLPAWLADEHCHVRAQALALARQLTPLPEWIVAQLPARLVDEDLQVRIQALVLARQLMPLPEWIIDQLPVWLVDEDKDIRTQALALAHQLTPLPAAIVAQLPAWLADEHCHVLAQALVLASQLTPLPATIVTQLPAWLVDERYRFKALMLARQLKPLPEWIVDQLPVWLVDEDEDIRTQALALARQLTPLPAAIVDQLPAWLVDEDLQVRNQAFKLAKLLTPLPAAIVAQLPALLVDGNYLVHYQALMLARQLKPLPEWIVDQLPALLVRKDRYVRKWAFTLAGQLRPLPEAIVARLPALLVDERDDVRTQALKLAERLTPLTGDDSCPVASIACG